MKLYADGFVLNLDSEKAQKALGKRKAKILEEACDKCREIYYVQAEKKRNGEKDSIAVYDRKSSQYVIIAIKALAKCAVDFNEDAILKEVKSIMKASSNPTTKKKQLKTTPTDLASVDNKLLVEALCSYISKQLRKGLTRRSLHTLVELNYWINFASKTLHIKHPNSESEITDRYLKTLKVYAMAYYIGRNVPVPILRSVLRSLDYTCPTISEIKNSTDLPSAVTSVISTNLDTSSGKETVAENKIETKCQVAYPVSMYMPTTFVLGTRIEQMEDGVVKQVAETDFLLDNNVMFVVKNIATTLTRKGDKLVSQTKPKADSLLFYIPMPLDKKVDKVASTGDLVEVAYAMAVSLNYPLVRIDFK